MMEPVQAKLNFNADFTSAEALDIHGRSTGKMLEPDSDGAYHIDGRFTTMYYIFRRPAPDTDPPAGAEIAAGMDAAGMDAAGMDDAGASDGGDADSAGEEMTAGDADMSGGDSEMSGSASSGSDGCQSAGQRGG